MTASKSLLRRLRRVLGSRRLLVDEATLSVYARDASHQAYGRPLAVAVPADAEEARLVVAACAEARVPLVVRGAGTGLSGGALPCDGAVVLATAALDGIGPVDPERRVVTVGPGVINERVGRAAAAHGLHYAPDPSSQAASTIGGNIAENAGGPHTLKVGVTLHHVRRLDWVDAAGRPWTTGWGLSCERGIDLKTLLVGSEGTLGLVTAAELQLVPAARDVATLLAVFARLDDAARAVVGMLGAGLLPAAVEMVDHTMLHVVEAAFRIGLPTDADAAVICELDGGPEAVREDAERAMELLRGGGAREVRRARDETERQDLWRCRKKAFGAVGRLSPSYVTMDVVVPLGRLPGLAAAIGRIKDEHGVEIATAYHAGDGNLHPGVHYDDRDPDSVRRAHAAADAILAAALELGGSVSGEHGIGREKLHVIGWQLDPAAAALMRGVARVFDPAGLLNPGKALPPPDADVTGGRRLPAGLVAAWDSLTITAPAEVPVADLQAAALRRGLWIPVGAVVPAEGGVGLGSAGTVGDLVDHLHAGPSLLGRGTARDVLLEVWAETGDGRLFHAGAPVFKNVAGYDLARLCCGAGGILGKVRAATFQLRPVPEAAALWHWRWKSGGPAGTDLEELVRMLAGWETDLAAPLCVVDVMGVGVRSLTVVAAGRERAWDLDGKGAAIAAWAGAQGLGAPDAARWPFGDLALIPSHPALPAWARRSGEWSFLSPLDGRRGWPASLGRGRWIWQAAPHGFWVPQARIDAGAGWHADTVWWGGQRAPLPPPAPGVSRDLLVALKDLFDPRGWLGEPEWLEEARGEQP